MSDVSLLELACGDDPEAWLALGFAVEDGGRVRIGAVTLVLDGGGGGLRGWTLAGPGGAGGPDSIDGVATAWAAEPEAAAPAAPLHPNGAIGLDHVVLFTDSRDRTASALVDAGGDERRRAGPPAVPVAMSFVRLGATIVEVAEAGAPPRLWGLVAVVEDLDACAASLGEALGTPRPAVQPGRRIATVHPRPGLDTALAFMTPK